MRSSATSIWLPDRLRIRLNNLRALAGGLASLNRVMVRILEVGCNAVEADPSLLLAEPPINSAEEAA